MTKHLSSCRITITPSMMVVRVGGHNGDHENTVVVLNWLRPFRMMRHLQANVPRQSFASLSTGIEPSLTITGMSFTCLKLDILVARVNKAEIAENLQS